MLGQIFKTFNYLSSQDKQTRAPEVDWIFPTPEETSRSYFLQETRDLAFRRYNEKMGEDTCHNNMDDFLRDDPVLAMCLLREVVELLAAERGALMSEDQRRIKDRELIHIATVMEDNHRRERKKQRKAKAKEICMRIRLDRKESFEREMKKRNGAWEKMKWRLICVWRPVESEEESRMLGSGPIYNPNGWPDREQMERDGYFQEYYW